MSRQNVTKSCMNPEISVPYTRYLKPESFDEKFDSLEKASNQNIEPRSTFLKIGAMSKIKGSAYMEYGQTKVLASVEPPREIVKQAMKSGVLGVVICSVKYSPFAIKDPESTARKESYLNTALRKALEPVVCRHEFANFELEIKVLIIDDDGCALSTAINCCGAALIHGGIPTYGLIVASTVSVIKGLEFLNPSSLAEELASTSNEEDEEHGTLVTASLDSVGQVTEFFQKGFLTKETVDRLFKHALEINISLLHTIRYVLLEKLQEDNAPSKETST